MKKKLIIAGIIVLVLSVGGLVAAKLLLRRIPYSRLVLKNVTPIRPEEPLAANFSLQKAGESLDTASVQWTRQFKCGTCHTNYPYMMARPMLGDTNAPAATEVRTGMERIATYTAKPIPAVEVVVTAVVLAINDAETTGKLAPVTRQTLDRMWTMQRPDGSWDWIEDGPPIESDQYYEATLGAIGVGSAPDGYMDTPAAKAGMEKLRSYLKKNSPPNLHDRAALLWASTKVPDLMSPKEQQATVDELLARQRTDGGWSLPSLGSWKREDGSPNEPQASDGYATGLVVYVLRQAGLPANNPAIERGVSWLMSNQRESGRWFTRSLYSDRFNYISNAGTAYAVMALKACGVEDKPTRQSSQ